MFLCSSPRDNLRGTSGITGLYNDALLRLHTGNADTQFDAGALVDEICLEFP